LSLWSIKFNDYGEEVLSQEVVKLCELNEKSRYKSAEK
jgi:hypothetical protein